MQRWVVDSEENIVSFVQGRLKDPVSKKEIRRLMERHCCSVNGVVERFGSKVLRIKDIVEWRTLTTKESNHSLDILLDHPDFQIVNKPQGVVCHHQRGLVHRLDKETTGALLIAKSESVKEELMELFAQRRVYKTYLALVDGVVTKDFGVCRSLLAPVRSFEGQTIWGARSRGKEAVTRWQVVRRFAQETLVACYPLTGRTHQIRVHMAELGAPLLLDRQYGRLFRSGLRPERPLLHAHVLEFVYRQTPIKAVAPLPFDMRQIIRGLGMDVRESVELFGQKGHNAARYEGDHGEKSEELG
jgi:23S rRNA-/tRNA-specific pseudouridylate synthase